jgi:predicted nucleotidyltransferase
MSSTSGRRILTRAERAALNRFLLDARGAFGSNLLRVTLFGSRARGAGGRDSDLDVLVVLAKADASTIESVRYLAADATLAYGPEVATRVWSHERLEAEQARPGGLYQNILRDGVPLWEGGAGAPAVEAARSSAETPAGQDGEGTERRRRPIGQGAEW